VGRSALADVDQRLLIFAVWPELNDALFGESDRKVICSKRRAIELFLSGESKKIPTETGLDRRETIRLIKRCLVVHEDGRIFGFRALAPYVHVFEYRREKMPIAETDSTHAGLSGSFEQLLRIYPELRGLIETFVLKLSKKKYAHESRIPLKSLHKLFLDKCRELGLNSPPRYPFGTETLGHRALSVYVRKLLLENGAAAIPARFGKDAAKKMQAGDGTARPIFKPYGRVECDAHHIDAIFCVLIPSIFGELVPKIIRRLWLIVIKDVASRAILGYALSMRLEINEDDLLAAIRFSLGPWKPRALSIPNMEYHRGAGFPGSHNSRLLGACWEEFSVDGAMANHAAHVKHVLDELVGSEPVTLSRHNPNDRPFVERFFKTLEENGFHRLPNTTGDSVDDPRRDNPELAATEYRMQLDHLEDLIDVMIANFNAEPHTSNGYRSPLEYLEYLCAHGNDWPPTADQSLVQRLTVRRRSVIVRGNLESGHRPHINFEGVKYTNELLRQSLGLIGKSIFVEWEGDIRIIKGYTEQGSELGSLRAAPPWHLTPHTLEMRRAVNSLRNRKVLHYLEGSDPIHEYLTHLVKTSREAKVVPSAYLQAIRVIQDNADSSTGAFESAVQLVPKIGSIEGKIVAINEPQNSKEFTPIVLRKGRKAING